MVCCRFFANAAGLAINMPAINIAANKPCFFIVTTPVVGTKTL